MALRGRKILDPKRAESFNVDDTQFDKIIVGSALGVRTYDRTRL